MSSATLYPSGEREGVSIILLFIRLEGGSEQNCQLEEDNLSLVYKSIATDQVYTVSWAIGTSSLTNGLFTWKV